MKSPPLVTGRRGPSIAGQVGESHGPAELLLAKEALEEFHRFLFDELGGDLCEGQLVRKKAEADPLVG